MGAPAGKKVRKQRGSPDNGNLLQGHIRRLALQPLLPDGLKPKNWLSAANRLLADPMILCNFLQGLSFL
jgi:hypothetical protein